MLEVENGADFLHHWLLIVADNGGNYRGWGDIEAWWKLQRCLPTVASETNVHDGKAW